MKCPASQCRHRLVIPPSVVWMFGQAAVKRCEKIDSETWGLCFLTTAGVPGPPVTLSAIRWRILRIGFLPVLAGGAESEDVNLVAVYRLHSWTFVGPDPAAIGTVQRSIAPFQIPVLRADVPNRRVRKRLSAVAHSAHRNP